MRRAIGIAIAAIAALAAPAAAAPSITGPFVADAGACVLRDGQPVCWGVDARLVGDARHAERPNAVPGVTGLVTMSLGDAHACGLDGKGAVRCFGAQYGEEGDMADDVDTPALPPAIAIGLGEAHQCAISTKHEVWCWGADDDGEVDGTPGPARAKPVEVAGVHDAVELAIGKWRSCARSSAGAVTCWGRPHSNDLTADEVRVHAIAVAPSAQLVASGQLVCSRSIKGGAIECFGEDASALSPADEPGPIVTLAAPAGTVEIAAATDSVCARTRDGAIACAGIMADELGHAEGTRGRFVAVGGARDAAALAAGGGTGCARSTSGAIACWGDRNQLGGSFGNDVPAPVAVPGPRGVVAIDAEGQRTCAIDGTAHVWCWGGGNDDDAIAHRIDDLHGATRVSVGDRVVCAIVAGAPRCYAPDRYAEDAALGHGPGKAWADGARPVADVAVGAAVTAIAVSVIHGCAITGAGALSCWGEDQAGVLGRPQPKQYPDAETPREVPGLRGVTAVAVARQRTCAIVDGGGVRCFGAGDDGLLGDGRIVASAAPRAVIGIDHAVAIDLGDRVSCVRRDDGGAACWGDEALTPVPWPGVDDAVELAVGPDRACVVRRGGALECGLPGVSARVAGLDDAVHVAVGGGHTCAVRRGGDVVCWGTRRDGALGDGVADFIATAVTIRLP